VIKRGTKKRDKVEVEQSVDSRDPRGHREEQRGGILRDGKESLQRI